MNIKIALVYGSTREGRLCDKVAAWATTEIMSHKEFQVDAIDPITLSLPNRHDRGENAGLVELKQRIGEADAFVIVTPEYNHSFPASLKFLIDSVNQQWQTKPVGFISYGGISGGLRAVEQLRQVFAELHAVTLRDSVSFADAWSQFDQAGNLIQPTRARKALSVMLSRMHWWAVALRNAREVSPYEWNIS